jgi:CheY-like chemotaxis protein
MSTSNESRPPAILIVEDDVLLLLNSVDIVEDAGYIAIEANNADEAIAILESRQDIALLITDVQMPGSMDGLTLAHAVRDRWPPIKIMVVSGQVDLAEHELPANSRFLSKPFHAERLVSELRHLIAPQH